MQDKTVDKIAEAYAILNRAHAFWEYYARDLYVSQIGIIKTYLWIAITLLTAHAVIYDHFQEWIGFQSLELRGIVFCFSASTAFVAMILGLTCLSQIFLVKTDFTVPSNNALFEINSMEKSDFLISTRYTILKGICFNYDHTYAELAKVINARGYRMRAQCICCILSALGTFGLIISIIFYGG